ncbi:MAG: hypothetical protein GY952_10095 [Rhodobacteraceae bacterium]|nr:hypothetical protein [Paracoccaceae bacterium]
MATFDPYKWSNLEIGPEPFISLSVPTASVVNFFGNRLQGKFVIGAGINDFRTGDMELVGNISTNATIVFREVEQEKIKV